MSKIIRPKASANMEFRLGTFNMSGHEYQANWPEVASYLEAEDINAVLLQEVVYLPNREMYRHGSNSADLLNVHTYYPHVVSAIERKWHDRVHDEPRHEGLAVLTQYVPLEQRIRWLMRDPRDEHKRFIQFVKLDLGSRTAWLANIHNSLSDPPPNFATAHTQEVFKILDEFAQEIGEYPIVGGDFNLEDPRKSAGKFIGGYVMSRQVARGRYITNPNAIGAHGRVDRGIDHLGVPPGSTIQGVKISKTLSDHSIVSANVGLFVEAVSSLKIA